MARTRARRRRIVIRAAQAALPAGFHAVTGKPVPLRAVVSTRTPTVQGKQLTVEQRRVLTILRLKKQKHIALASSCGDIDRHRAIAEVQQDTSVGKALIEIEHLTMELVRKEAERRARARRKRAI